MIPRVTLFPALAAAFALVPLAAVQAFEFQPYQTAVVEKAIQSGAPVVVHVFAPWCLQCQAQKSILSGLAGDRTFDRVKLFRVGYDDQKDVVAALAVPRSTLIAYKGGKEVARMSWGTSQDDVVKVLRAAE
jgi:thioredoxin-like negative regulator of GroEL